LSFFSADILTIISNQKKKKKMTDIKCSRSSLMMHTAVQADLGGGAGFFLVGETAARGESLISWCVEMRETWEREAAALAAAPACSATLSVKSKGLVMSSPAKISGGRAWEGWRR